MLKTISFVLIFIVLLTTQTAFGIKLPGTNLIKNPGGTNILKNVPLVGDDLDLLLSKDKTANIFITISDGPQKIFDKLVSMTFGSHSDQVNAAVNSLKDHANQTQVAVLRVLQEFAKVTPIKIKPYWITNQIYVQGANKVLVALLKALGSAVISFISLERFSSLGPTQPAVAVDNGNMTWGLQIIQLPEAMKIEGANDGTGVIVGSIDSGVRYTHEALRDNYIGENGWYDPVEETPLPNDDNGHGTHTCGTMVGKGGIGVAPGAKWLACKGCQDAQCSQSDILSCGQFMMCPTKPDGTNPDCSKAPHVINNSWGGPGGDSSYREMIKAWKSANIIPVFANGNEGPMCRTAGSPGDYPEVISVGATNNRNELASFSSRGPANGVFGIGGNTKPDLSGPGEAVKSAWLTSDTAYNVISGTSMATPHVTGLVALMLSTKPGMMYDEVRDQLLKGCITTGLKKPRVSCDLKFIRAYTYPNNDYGKGLINAKNTLQNLVSSA